MRDLLRLWFGLTRRVVRRTYLLHGAALTALKLGVDVLAVFFVTGQLWTPLDYVSPMFSVRGHLYPKPEWLLGAMAVWALPFLWIGISMSLRRALDAGISPWIALLFFVPYLNWVLICALALAPSRPRAVQTTAPAGTDRLRAAVLGVGLASLALALEGGICVAMALPLALPLGMLGAIAGRAMRAEHLSTRAAFAIAFAVPASAGLEKSLAQAPLREVVSSVEIAAPSEKVWTHVIRLSDLPAPAEWFFRSGIAYPVRARITGTGVGAVRRCEFSTGAFIEPITAWDPPRRLGFDVASEPPPMQEWSPYRHLDPPHLAGTMRSRRGEFRLV